MLRKLLAPWDSVYLKLTKFTLLCPKAKNLNRLLSTEFGDLLDALLYSADDL